MAKDVTMTYPLDTPRMIKPGVSQHEADFHGSAKWYALPPEAPLRQEKGDLGLSVIKDFDSKPLTTPGAPFANLRGGK